MVVASMQVIASMPGASQQTSAAILSSVAFDKDAVNFATAGVSKRISVYNYADAVATYAAGQSDEVQNSLLVPHSQASLGLPLPCPPAPATLNCLSVPVEEI